MVFVVEEDAVEPPVVDGVLAVLVDSPAVVVAVEVVSMSSSDCVEDCAASVWMSVDGRCGSVCVPLDD